MAKVRSRKPGKKKESGEKTSKLNRRALLSKIAAGLALTAAGPARALNLEIEGKTVQLHLKGETLELVPLSTGSLKYNPEKVRLEPTKRGDGYTIYCPKEAATPTPTPTPK